MNLEAVLCPYCRGTGLERNRDLPRPASHSRYHEPPISGRTGCGCTWDTCSHTHVVAETPLLMADGTKSAAVTYLDPARVVAMGWLIETRETEPNE